MKKLFLLAVLLITCAFATSLDEKIGQMIIVGFDGNNIQSLGFKKIQKQLKNGDISGVIYFSKNIQSKNSIKEMNKNLINSSKTIPFISIDNEGGQIQRHNFIQNKSAKEISFLDEKLARDEYQKMANLLNEMGFNLNFAPCVDLELNKDSIISKKERSYGKNPDIVSKYASIFIEEHNKYNIATSIKHFPGHGSVDGDTHKGFVDSTQTYKKEELLPYINLLQYDEKNMVMVSHVYNKNFDEKYPASLSNKTINGFLRQKIGFDGIIVSDDYDMRAIRDNYSLKEIVENSINSGINLMIFSGNISKNDKNEVKKIKKIVKQGIKTGAISLENIENSYEKIINLKKSLKN